MAPPDEVITGDDMRSSLLGVAEDLERGGLALVFLERLGEKILRRVAMPD